MLDSANFYITKAHILNKYNPRLKEKLSIIRDENETPWKDWYFHPQYSMTKTKKGVSIKMKSEWMGYAFVKAIWAYEPGYYESMTGDKNENTFINSTEEREAVLSLLSHNKNLIHIENILFDGYFDEFFYYEIVGNQQPLGLLLTSDEQKNKIVEYLIKYH